MSEELEPFNIFTIDPKWPTEASDIYIGNDDGACFFKGTSDELIANLKELEALRVEVAGLRDKVAAAITLYECVECGQPAFSISPIDPSDGFCWNCRKLLTVRVTLCECAIREAGSSVCHKCHRPYYHDRHVFTGRNA